MERVGEGGVRKGVWRSVGGDGRGERKACFEVGRGSSPDLTHACLHSSRTNGWFELSDKRASPVVVNVYLPATPTEPRWRSTDATTTAASAVFNLVVCGMGVREFEEHGMRSHCGSLQLVLVYVRVLRRKILHAERKENR